MTQALEIRYFWSPLPRNFYWASTTIISFHEVRKISILFSWKKKTLINSYGPFEKKKKNKKQQKTHEEMETASLIQIESFHVLYMPL